MNQAPLRKKIVYWICRYFNSRERLTFFLAGFILAQAFSFAYIQSSQGQFDRVGRQKGRDFLQFYISGRIVRSGNAHRLYDQDFFLQQQKELTVLGGKNPPYLSMYPPLIGLIFAPLAGFSYMHALFLWWFILALCFVFSGLSLLKQSNVPYEWKRIAALAIIAFYPVADTFWNGQLSGLWLLVFIIALSLLRKESPLASGLTFSLLALKPQLLIGVAIWCLIKRDKKVILGLLIGIFSQVWAVLCFLGHEVLAAYIQNLGLYTIHSRIFKFAPFHQHALPAVLGRIFGGRFGLAFNIIHLLIVIWAAGALYKIICNVSTENHAAPSMLTREDAALVIFVCIAAPHLLTYDLCLLLIPISWLWFSNMGKIQVECALGQLCYFLSTLVPFYIITRFSFVPFFLLICIAVLKQHPDTC